MKDNTKAIENLKDLLVNRMSFYGDALDGALKRKDKLKAVEYAAKVEAYREAYIHVLFDLD